MGESKLYSKFFQRNLLIFVVCLVVFGVSGFIFSLNQPITYQRTRLFQMDYSQTDVAQKISLADEAVSVIRSENVNSQLGVSGKTSLTVFKPGPLLISLSVGSGDGLVVQTVLNNASDYLTSHFPVSAIGLDTATEIRPKLYFGLGIGMALGVLIGVLISLIREYFKNF